MPHALENVDWDSAGEVRRRYIEARTRRVLEGKRGELGDGGEEIGGRRRGEEEVASLEGLVALGFGGKGRGDGRVEMES